MNFAVLPLSEKNKPYKERWNWFFTALRFLILFEIPRIKMCEDLEIFVFVIIKDAFSDPRVMYWAERARDAWLIDWQFSFALWIHLREELDQECIKTVKFQKFFSYEYK